MKALHEEAITAAARKWGNFGPLEYWVSGKDVAKADELADEYCSHRESRDDISEYDCMRNKHTAKFLPEMAAKVCAAIQSGDPFSSAGRNGHRDLGIHLFSSSYPLGYAGLLGVPVADDQKTAFHEYFHAVQHAYISTRDRETRDAVMGPIWFAEGGAEFMAQTATQKLRDAGALSGSESAPLAERMLWKRCRSGWSTILV